ncbi:Sec63 Brl domain-domain-containing protein [Protomyces lactucae-debilis]|uniref:RNA helicase n=1 Tax=Protomyces lactucae-debilis TaxID=2754530 RepID=A0A1Y2FBR8_PROLT|nr:Sec63 Brl domain-containing protein [Protomyces lactucae-debilis]ORY80305.1 Sec63 Brl domain-domain-containing protein [Protomyces lactucae-debilis]
MAQDEAPKNPYADYSYSAMSNLVTKADRRQISKRDGETTGEPETLAGRIDIREMGARARAPPSIKPEASNRSVPEPSTRKRKQSNFQHASILEATAGLEGLRYRPVTSENRDLYDTFLALVSNLLGDQSPDIIRSAGDVAIETIKNASLKDLDKKQEIESVIGGAISEGDFVKLCQIAGKITDFERQVDAEEDLDENTGVAVIIGEEEEDEQRSSASESEYEEMEGDELDDSVDQLQTGGQVDLRQERVRIQEIDALWLSKEIAKYYLQLESKLIQGKAHSALELLESPISAGLLENDLMELFDYDKYPLVSKLIENRAVIVWGMRLSTASDKERPQIQAKIDELGLSAVKQDRGASDSQAMEVDPAEQKPLHLVELEDLAFSEGNHLMSNKKVTLPEGSFKQSHPAYEEVHVPAPKRRPDDADPKVPITDLPRWAQAAFGNTTSLNRIQSRMYSTAFGKDENLLLCAPTGAGKTNVAMLCILNELAKYRLEDGSFDLKAFKIVYVAPLKALVSEMVGNFSSRLSSYGVQVSELTGDSQLTKRQISDTQIIVTTPEKWDVITRKATETSYTNLVRLLIIDEIHLLHDDRGPVLESIICRAHRVAERGAPPIRLVGLSATLPNYQDVATFLRVDPATGIFYFDQTYRPCPLQQQFIGLTEKKPIKRLQMMNTVCYQKALESVAKGNQVLIFVHSRKETYKTAKFIRDEALAQDTIQRILKSDAASREILTRESEAVRDAGLKEMLPYGLAMHHAGMSKADRTTAEDLFAEGLVQILVSTATLAWGVNLPAHTVIIKGTQVYSPEKGTWVELSPQDVLQMLGRAGRPQYDTFGEGIIITNQAELQYYLSLINQQLPIESQFVSRLSDNLNAEVVLGSIKSRDDAVKWLGCTYLFIRMLQSPALYKVGADYESDPLLVQKRVDLVHSAATVLARCQLVKYNVVTGSIVATELGRIASHYYVSHASVKTYNAHLRSNITHIDLFRIFALSDEFKYIPVREDEKLELAKVMERVPIPVRDLPDEPSCKINVLLQAHISRLKLDGFALVADMVYVTQSAGRIMRSIFEICLKRGWAGVARLALDMCKMIEKSLWHTRSPLAQFKECPADLLRKLERKDFPWPRYLDLDPQELAELTGDSNSGRLVHRLIHQLPRLQVAANVQPITSTLLRVELTIVPEFDWTSDGAEAFWIIVEDVDGEQVLYHDQFVLRRQYATEEHTVDFCITVTDPTPPLYFVSLISDRWMHSETKIAIPLRNMALPSKFPSHTPLVSMESITTEAFQVPEFVALYDHHLNKVETQTFNTLFKTDESCLIAVRQDLTFCAEVAILKLWLDGGKALFLDMSQDKLERLSRHWQKFEKLGKTVVLLADESAENLRLLQSGDLILSTPKRWEELSRRWKQRKNVQAVRLIIASDLHKLGGVNGSSYEICLSRSRYMSAQLETSTRIIALSVSLADARDLSDWLGISKANLFNFSPAAQETVCDITLQSFSIPHHPSLMIAMAKAASEMLDSTIIFVSDRKQCLDTALELAHIYQITNTPAEFETGFDAPLDTAVKCGIGYIHEASEAKDIVQLEKLFTSKVIRCLLVSTFAMDKTIVHAEHVIIMDTQHFDGSQHRYTDYPVSDILQMLQTTTSAVIMLPAAKKAYYKKFIDEALPIESGYLQAVHDNFCTEISMQTIETKQEAVDWLTWTLFYRRLSANPAFYGLEEPSHEALSVYLSDLVESTLAELVEGNLISLDEDEMQVEVLNLGMIAAHYAISHITMQTFGLSLTARTKLKGLLEICSAASEFDALPVRKYEDVVLRRIYDRLPVKLDIRFDDPHHKAFILMQAHFSRFTLPADLQLDQCYILPVAVRVLSACVDVMSSEGFMNAVNAMEMSQMLVQAMWDRDSPLKQVPFFTAEVIERCKAAGVEEVTQIAELEDAERDKVLQMSAQQLNEVALFCNRYPDVDMVHEWLDVEVPAGETARLKIDLSRADDDFDPMVLAPLYPQKKLEHWWLVVSSEEELLAIKKVTLQQQLSVVLEVIPRAVRASS